MSLSALARIISWLKFFQSFDAMIFVIIVSSAIYFGSEMNLLENSISAQFQVTDLVATRTVWEVCCSKEALALLLGLAFYIGLNLIVFTVGVILYYVKWTQSQNPKTVAGPGEVIQHIRPNRCPRRG